MSDSIPNSKWKIEIFIPSKKLWVSLQIKDFYDFLLNNNLYAPNNKFSLSSIPNLILKENKDQVVITDNLIKKGNYIEFKSTLNCSLKYNEKEIELIKEKNNSSKDVWIIAKIISFDLSQNIFLLECKNKIFQANSLEEIRPLSVPKSNTENEDVYYLDSIEGINKEMFEIFQKFFDENESLFQKLYFYEYAESMSTLISISTSKQLNFIREIIEIKQKTYETIKKFDNEIENERKNLTTLKGILKTSSKKIIYFNTYFKEKIEKELQLISSINYTFLNSSEEQGDFALIIYAPNEQELNNSLKRVEFTQEIIKCEGDIDIEKLKEIASKTKLEEYFVEEEINNIKNVYLFGNPKKISDFKKIWSITMKYNKEIIRNQQENEVMKKKLTNLKKEFNLK